MLFMKKYLLPTTIILMGILSIFLYLFIHNSCVPSYCTWMICSSDCDSENRNYSLVWISSIITLVLSITWLYTFFIKKDSIQN